jgi:hypothetical protein
MEDIFSTLLTLIPLALFVGLRIVAARRKKAADGDTAKLASAIRAVGGPAADEEPRPLHLFSAHSLQVDESHPSAGRQQRRKRETSGLGSALPIAAVGSPEPMEPAPRAVAAPANAAAGVSALARVERLPALKRAIVYAELLGDPKGL